jgi:hypothetical protein
MIRDKIKIAKNKIYYILWLYYVSEKGNIPDTGADEDNTKEKDGRRRGTFG